LRSGAGLRERRDGVCITGVAEDHVDLTEARHDRCRVDDNAGGLADPGFTPRNLPIART
jgi:hypothetical protein